MEQDKVNVFLTTNSKFFPQEKIFFLKEQLLSADESKLFAIQTLQYKDPMILLIVSILIGSLGVDRFMLGQTGLGVAKLLTCGGFGIWTIVDWFLIMNLAREENFKSLMNALNF
ncbi:MAG: TM2 domain-containing protein [Ignavibacteriaceae bacterium]|nr:TM2 domain-containing protein [Ignavibacteriaceae bacterium]